jgi:hypothetical protein
MKQDQPDEPDSSTRLTKMLWKALAVITVAYFIICLIGVSFPSQSKQDKAAQVAEATKAADIVIYDMKSNVTCYRYQQSTQLSCIRN